MPAPVADTQARSRLSPVERVLRLFTEIRAGEGRTALLLFASVFLILCAYYFIKPLREGWLAASEIAGLSKIEVRAYTAFGQSLLLLPIVSWYGALVGRWPRRVLIERATLFCMSNMIVFWALQPGFGLVRIPGIGVFFYLWVGIFAVFVVAQFWAFAADLYTQERGNRLLPLIAIGATAGGAGGSALVGWFVSTGFVPERHLLLAALVPLAASLLLTRAAETSQGVTLEPKRPAPGAAAFDRGHRGALRLVFGTRFLLAVGVIMLLANWVKTNGENQLYDVLQQTLQAQAHAQGLAEGAATKSFLKAQTTAFYGDFFFWVNLGALSLQALAASRILKYGGFAGVFLLLPVIALGSYAAMALLPVLWLVRGMQVPVNATDYSIQNTARHVLWLPMSQEVTFKGKPAIDTFFVRAGDGMAALTVLVGVQLLSAATRSFFVLNVLLAVTWLGASIWVVRRHRRLVSGGDAGDPSGTHGGGNIHGRLSNDTTQIDAPGSDTPEDRRLAGSPG